MPLCIRDKLDIFLKVICCVLFFVFLLLFFFRPVEIEDGWWHLKTGEWIVNNHQVPNETLFSFDEQNSSGQALNTQWLGSCLYYLTYKSSGFTGLKVMRTIIFALSFFIFFMYAYRKVPFSLLITLAVLMVFGLETQCLLRPFLFNLLFVQIFLVVLFDSENKFDLKKLFILPLLGIIWANIHLGSFFYGNALFGIFLFSAVVDYFNARLFSKDRNIAKENVARIKGLFLVWCVYMLAFFMTPYGLKGFIHPFKVFLLPGFINFQEWGYSINGMMPPNYLMSLRGIWAWGLFVLGVIFLKNCRCNKLTNSLLFACALFLFLHSARGAGFFVFITVYVIIRCWRDKRHESKWCEFFQKRMMTRVLCGAMSLFFVIFIIRALNAKVYYHGQMTKAFALEYAPYNPEYSLKLLKENNIKGRMFNDHMNGGYVLWSSYPDLKPFVDGRLEGHPENQERFSRHLEIMRNPERYWLKAEEEFRFKVALLDLTLASSDNLLTYLHRAPDWQLISIDGIYSVFVKRGVFQLPDELNDFEKNLKSAQISRDEFSFMKEMKAKKTSFSIKTFFDPPPYYMDIIEEGRILLQLGYMASATKLLVEAFKVSEAKARASVRIGGHAP